MSVQEVGGKIVGFLVGIAHVIYWYIEALYRKFVPPPMKSIDGETVLVTGAVGGIGKEMCKHLLWSGSNLKLVLWDLNQTDLDKLAAELKTVKPSGGHKLFPMSVDISTRENIDAAAKQVKNTVGAVSILFNNAGIAPNGNFLHLTNEEIEKTIDINLMSHFWIIRQFLPEMVAKNHGRIVCTASMGGLKAAPGAFPYFASKFGVNGMMDALKIELQMLKYDGVHCTTVYPYFVKTPLIRSLDVDSQKGGVLPKSFQRFLEPSEVAILAVDGMRREYEFVYAPSTIPFITFADYLMPLKLQKAIRGSYFEQVYFKDEAEQKRLTTPYTVPAVNGKSKKEK